MFLNQGFLFRKTVIYRCGIVCFTCIGTSSLVGTEVCLILNTLSGLETCRRHKKIKNENINLEKAHYVGLYSIHLLQCAVQKNV